ncbi:hypothetical protein B0T17DRAFT_615260 [Bombardia bombarda]|uniref:Uncharacterized protein n=1 Tax=Bombardia bombarda TaxID=252184 RepID=A0AA40C918_9PEZI|nr:hypothetical protein B0T17DRAFT_615260 [Bombardia bombarda]
MPSIRLPPDSNVAFDSPPSGLHFPEAFRNYIYFALVAVAITLAVSKAFLSLPEIVSSRIRTSSNKHQHHLLQNSTSQEPAALYSREQTVVSLRNPTRTRASKNSSSLILGNQQRGKKPCQKGVSQQPVIAAADVLLGSRTGLFGPPCQVPAMDEDDTSQMKDHSWSALTTSRGVSTNADIRADTEHPTDPSSSDTGSWSNSRSRGGRSPRSLPQHPSTRHNSGSSDGASGQGFMGKGEGKESAESHSSWTDTAQGATWSDEIMASQLGGSFDGSGSSRDVGFADVDYTTSAHFYHDTRPPPLSPQGGSTFLFQDRHPSYAISIPPKLETSYIHRANPSSYFTASTSTDILSSSPRSTTDTPRRRSSTKRVSVGIPIPNATSASSSTETMTSGVTFSPSSYPPTSPLLPPPPPGYEVPYNYQFVGGPGRHGLSSAQHDMELVDAATSVTHDAAGHCWQRHTRVYGGGVCLACLAATEGEGGFYGDKVPLADRR